MRKLTYVNPNGVSIVLSDAEYGITSVTGLDVPDMTIQEKKAPYQDGSTHIDQLLEPREVVVEGVIGYGKILDIYTHRRIMISAFNPKIGPGTLLYENDNGSWFLSSVTPNGPTFANKNANEMPQKYQITFHCYDPYWKDSSETQYIQEGEGSIDVVNNGDVNCPVTIVINGPITNPKILNVTTGEYIQLTKTIAAGEYVIISTDYGNHEVSLYSSETPLIEFDNFELPEAEEFSTITESNGMGYLVLDSTFFMLDTGISTLELIDSGSNTGMSMIVSYRQRYIGV